MAIEGVLIPAATGIIGIVVGLAGGSALILRQRREPIPAAGQKGVWEHLRELTAQRAEAAAKKRALHRAYAAGSVNEHGFVTKDAHYTKIVEQLDEEIDKTVMELSKAFLPEEMQKGDAKLKELSDLAVLSKKIAELKQDKGALEEERGRLYLQLTELEEDKKAELAEKNKIRAKYEKDTKSLDEMLEGISRLEAQRRDLEKKVSGIVPRDQAIANLQKENRRLREGFSNARERIASSEREKGVLEAIINRHSKEIDEARKQDEMKELVQPGNPGVAEIAKKCRDPKEVFEYVRDSIEEVHPQVSASYWLGIDDIIRLGAADPDDKAILLCSVLRAQGHGAHVAMLEMKNGYRRAVVLTDDHLLDPAETRRYDDYCGLSAEEALGKYTFDGFPAKRLLFKFNEKRYEDGKG